MGLLPQQRARLVTWRVPCCGNTVIESTRFSSASAHYSIQGPCQQWRGFLLLLPWEAARGLWQNQQRKVLLMALSDDEIESIKQHRAFEMALLTSKAEAAHDIWAHWMKFMFTQGQFTKEGDFLIPFEKVARWQRQMLTTFEDLPPEEQKSDFEIAQKFLSGL